ncbi:MAG: hypothetical protein M0P09_01305 [Acholeplasmataceae bacterium]|nr:hypothetical protein [Acholeplasmataceae bacterium]
MALKKILDSIDGLPEDVAKEYKEKDGKFILDIEGDDSESTIAHLTQKKSIAEEHRTKAEKRLGELQEELDNLRRGAIPKDDLTALEKSWQEKLDKAVEEGGTTAKRLKGQLNKVLIEDTAARIASELSQVPSLLAPTIAKRLAIEEVEGGDIKVRVKDAAGKPSALTLDELKTEIRSIEEYAPILIGSKGSGGGANGTQSPNSSGGKKFADLTDAERTEFYKRDPDGFRKAAGIQL